MKRLFLLTVLLLSGLTTSIFGQSDPAWDATGNNLLNGVYNFRETLWVTDTSANKALLRVTTRYGTINFDGAGNYTISGTEWNSDTSTSTPYTPTNTYTISAGGFGFLNRSSNILERVYGMVSEGIFIGNTAESPVNSLFIAARQPTTNVTTATFNQNYTVAYTNLATPNLGDIRDSTFQLTPNGAGSLGTVSATGYISESSSTTTQSIPGATYSFASGTGTLNLGTPSTTNLISGSKQLYVANGGKLIFGGSETGGDMLVGILTPSSTVPSTNFSGVYFQAGMDVDRHLLPSGAAYLNSYFGSLNAVPSLNSLVGHQRVQTAPFAAYEYTYSDTYTVSSSGSFDDFLGIRHFLSQDGAVRVGFGVGNYLGINVALKAPPLTGSGVFINPNGVVNAGSYSPFTTAVSPGEILAIYGTNLAPAGCPTNGLFPSSLCGVSVTINGRVAPIYYALPTQLAVLVPYEVTSNNIIEITVNNNGTTSNRVTSFVSTTSPGAFATPIANGLGYVAAYHGRLEEGAVSPQNPARPGEYIAVFLTGLGPVSPPITTGQAGPVNPLSRTTSEIKATIAKKQLAPADRDFAGIAPILHGTYQLNVRVPADVASPSDVFLDIAGPDALNSQIKIPVGGTPVSSSVVLPRSVSATQTRVRPDPPQGSTRRGSNSGSGASSEGQ